MRIIPELRRYLWLELSTARLVAMPLVIAALVLLVGASTWEAGQPGGGADVLQGISAGAVTCFVLLVLLWGTRLAAGAVVREVADRTWDQQRLSSVGAWDMAWGKLFGSTVYVWYGGLLLLAVAVLALTLWQVRFGGVAAAFGAPLAVVLIQTVVGLVALAVFVMATVMVAAMTTVARRETARQLDVSLAQIFVVAIALLGFSMFHDSGLRDRVDWYGLTPTGSWFVVASLVVFAAWAVVGLWRRMQVELQVRTRPAMWPLFVLFTGFWLAGFVGGRSPVAAGAVVVAVTVLLAGYVPAILDRLDPVRLRRLIAALRARDVATVLRFAPSWLVNHAVALVAVAIAAVLLLVEHPSESAAIDGIGLVELAAGSLVAAFLFVTRDLLLLVFAGLGRGGRRAFATWLLWMALLYGVVPLILVALGLFASLPMFVPAWDVPFADHAVPPVLWPLLQVVAVLGLLRWRWRRFATARLA